MTPQRKRIFVTGRYLPNTKQAHECFQFIGHHQSDSRTLLGQCTTCAFGPVVLFNRIRNLDGLAVMKRVVTTHRALQFGEFTDHISQQIGLGQIGRAFSMRFVRANQHRNLPSQILHTLHAL